MRETTKLAVAERLRRSMRQVTEALESDRPIESVLTCRKRTVKVGVVRFSPRKVQSVRKILGVSQALFAQFLGVSAATVRAWEQGVNPPGPMASRFLSEIAHDPEHWQRRLHESLVEK